MPQIWRPRLLYYAGLEAKPQVRAMAKALGLHPDRVAGTLLRVWLKFQTDATESGVLSGKTAGWLDLLADAPGFADAMAQAGWLEVFHGGLAVPNFDEFISKKAVKRHEGAVRKANARAAVSQTVVKNAEGTADKSGTTCDKVGVAPAAPKKPAAARKKTGKPPDPLFEAFYAAYPPDAAHKKPLAASEWAKLNVDPALAERIMDGLRRWVESPKWKEENGRFVPHPSNFLKHRRWEDRPPAAGLVGGPQPGGRVVPRPGKYDKFDRPDPADGPAPRPPDADPGPGPRPSLFPD